MTPAKMAICNEKTRPTVKVTLKVIASDRVARDTACICRPLMRDAPINITKVASAATGI